MFELTYRTVRNDPHTWRRVYYNKRGIQVGVISTYSHESEGIYIRKWHPFRVSTPLESSRRFIHYRSIRKAERFLRRELHPLGRFLNSLVIILTCGNKFARTGWRCRLT